MKKFFVLLLLVIPVFFTGCARNVKDVKKHAEKTFNANGFEVIGYQGYELHPIFGGLVWYTLKKGEITYQAAIIKWNKEYHIYNLEAIDAIKPNTK
jgi:hypothetical protein